MGHQFKPGDLALMLPNGRTVEILEDLGSPERLEWDGHLIGNPLKLQVYVVEFLSGAVTDCFGKAHKTGPLSERRLMPLKGDQQPAQVRQAERVQ